MAWHGYIAVEDLGMSGPQRATLWGVFAGLSPATLTGRPKDRNQWRLSLDGSQAILEMLFDEDDLSVAGFRGLLAEVFGVAAGSIEVDRREYEFGWNLTPVWTFARGGVDYFRVALFGGVGGDGLASVDACRDYLGRHLAEWEELVDG